MARFTIQDLTDAYERGCNEFDRMYGSMKRHQIPKYSYENPVLPFPFEELNDRYERGWFQGYENLVERSRTAATRNRIKNYFQ